MNKDITDIILVVDMQEGFCTNESCKDTYRKAKEFISHNSHEYFIFLSFINLPDSPFRTILDWDKMGKDTPEREVTVHSAAGISFPVVDKPYYGIAQNEELLSHLVSLNERNLLGNLYIFGVDTDCCVLKTAVDLFESGINVKVISDLCNSSGGEKYHEAGLLCVERLIGKENIIKSSSWSFKD